MLALAGWAGAPVAKASGIGRGWNAGVDFGVVTPLHNGAFFPQMRPAFGLNVGKAVSPSFSVGVEGNWAVNTSGWRGAVHSSTAFDMSYLGAVASVDLMNLFNANVCPERFFTTAVELGAGWGHIYNTGRVPDHNYFATKVGLAFNFNVARNLCLRLRPSVAWDMSDAEVEQSSAAYNVRKAVFQLQAGINFRFGKAFECVLPYDQAQIDGLNGQINDLRQRASEASTRAASAEARAARLQTELDACRSAKPTVVREEVVNNRLNTVLDIFFHLGSATITNDQMPNVERLASYMKSHPQSKVAIKGYASRDGNPEVNARLAQRRAEAVRDALIKKYKIAASRIQAEGAGIGDLFEEESWNRVSVCTLEN